MAVPTKGCWGRDRTLVRLGWATWAGGGWPSIPGTAVGGCQDGSHAVGGMGLNLPPSYACRRTREAFMEQRTGGGRGENSKQI